MKYLSVCSGIEAATQAWAPLGWKPVAFSEIEPFPCAVLAHHYPTVPNWGDMTKFEEWPDEPVDLLCGGTPCQSFSVAGLRQGLADPRGNLMLTYGAIARRYRPRWLVWENVPGVLSSNKGRDFAAFLGLLGELGYGWAYRVLDAQHVRTCSFRGAVPQRRRRVFVVGYLGDWRRAAAVLFDRESLSGHPAPRREAGKGFARGFETGPAGGGFADVAPTLDTRCKDGPIRNQLGAGVMCADIAPTLNAHFGEKQGLEDQHINGGAGLFVFHALRGEGFDASEDETGRGTPWVPIAFTANDNGRDVSMDGACPTLPKGGNDGSGGPICPAIAIQERAVSENPNAGPQGSGIRTDGAAYTLEARHHVQAVSYGFTTEQTPKFSRESALTLTKQSPTGGGQIQCVALPWVVRRLTPMECERLMGFPDGFTDVPYRKRNWTPDGPRYKALGNSWAVNVANYIGERIAEVDTWE